MHQFCNKHDEKTTIHPAASHDPPRTGPDLHSTLCILTTCTNMAYPKEHLYLLLRDSVRAETLLII